MSVDTEALIADFIRVAELAHIHLSREQVTVETLNAPHTPPASLPAGKMAVYIFFWNNTCLKVGKVGPKSSARYTYQHYHPRSSGSNLANSILDHREELELTEVEGPTVGRWIKTNTRRVNVLLDSSQGMPILALLEAFLHCRLDPLFEGFDSQR